LGKGGVGEAASRTRFKCAWGKFNQACINFDHKSLLEVKGKHLQGLSLASLVYGSESWAMKVNYMRRFERAENTMLR